MNGAILGLLLVANAGGAHAQQGDEWTVRVRSLLPFTRPSLQLPDQICTAIPGDVVLEAPVRLDAAAEQRPPTWVVTLLEQRHRTAVDAGRLSLVPTHPTSKPASEGENPNGASVILRGRTSDVAACERDLSSLAAALGRAIEVTAWRLPLPDGPLPPTSWDPAAVQQALQRTPPLWTARARTRSGGAVRLADERGIGILRDLDTEVAEQAKLYDPKIDVAFAGVRATLVVDALPPEELVLRGSWLLSEPVALHEQEVCERSLTVDLPEHKTAWISFAGRVASGGALVVAGRGGGVGPDGFVLVLGARYLAPASPDPAPDLLVRPVGALLAAAPPVQMPRSWPRPGEETTQFMRADRDGGLANNDLLPLLNVQPPAEVLLEGTTLVVHGDPGACRQCDALLQQLAGGLRAATLHTRAVGDGEVLELVQPVFADRAAGAFVGRERAVVKDHEVEIAAKMQAANPVVGVAYSGLWLGATAARSGDGWHMTGVWSLAAHDEPRERRHADRAPMVLQLVDYRLTTLPWDAAMAPNVEQALGDGPAWTKDGPATRVAVKLVVP
ncbi:MAG TPA: hypothetical protein VFD82_12195 [Planctomycetota bacterium]|nr:hypothetical protein [Planctomycetota bacterium]